MSKYKNLYIAATNQHVGKTTTTLGLVSGCIKRGLKVGYCKPVGQRFLDINNLKVDKDTILFADLINFEIIPEIHSPVILGRGATEHFLDDPGRYPFEQNILDASKVLNDTSEMVIYEGTGHPGVGSIANISNAHVAKILGAEVIMVVEGGIGNTIDRLNMASSLFREKGVPILGVIINKVRRDKLEKVKYYTDIWFKKNNLRCLGLIPYDRTLAFPLIKTISRAINGTFLHNEEFSTNKVGNILAGSLIDLNELKSQEDLLLLVSTKSLNAAINKIKWLTQLNNIDHCPLSGIVATGIGTIDQDTIQYIEKNKLPLIRTDIDTYGAVVKISRIEVKINKSTPWKVNTAIDLIQNHVDIEYVMENLKQ